MHSNDQVRGARYRWGVLAVASVSTLLGTSDFSIVTIALPTLTGVFKASTSTVVWVSLSYQLMTLGLVLPMGSAGDRFGQRNVFCLGILLYSIGLVAAAIAPNITILIMMRAIQGAGAAMASALAVGLVTNAFPSSQRGRALGMLASTAGVGLMAGPALGGLLLETLGWRSIFYIRAPVGFAGLAIALVYLAKPASKGLGRTDVLGTVLLFVGIAALTLGVNRGSGDGWTSTWVLILIISSANVLIAFGIHAARTTSPVVDLRLFRDMRLSVAACLMLMAGTCYMSINFILPFYLLLAKQMNPASAGLVLLISPALYIVLPPFTGRLADRVGPRWPTTSGLALQSISLFLFSGLTESSSLVMVGVILGISGIGNTLFQTPNQTAIMGAAPEGRVGTVSALIPMIRYVGLVAGVAVAEAIFSASLGPDSVNTADPSTIASAAAFTFPIFGVVSAIAAIVAMLRPDNKTA